MNAAMEKREPLPLVLGTAQLGMEYGVANSKGQPDAKEAVAIVQTAWENGIRFFDTAQAYGDSEQVLGLCFRELGLCEDERLKINTKLNSGVNLRDQPAITQSVEKSLKALGVKRLWSLMLHRESLLNEPIDLLRGVASRLKEEDKIEHFGVSVYSAEKALIALAIEELDTVQLPFNVFDQRALEQNLFDFAARKRKHLLVRSVYLQGLLLLDLNQIPPNLDFARGTLHSFHSFAKSLRIAPNLLCTSFVSQKARDALIIFGAESAEQVRDNVSLYREAANLNLPDMSFLSQKDPRLINPSHWYH